ncbi:YajG family lipoprotein [Pelotalea chapellei]|uniref:Uncharacterized protein n=1 Tax=Pelotalea chapellei TaxID=44671 RepID=A0ABS5U732_9BACT|nr:YajG family lipoprotein [Pelotalea chapellei]MBT1071453.1 hypothetical protein [Pelotalea chapellei]
MTVEKMCELHAKELIKKEREMFTIRSSVLMSVLLLLLFCSGCARYSRSVSTMYDPVSTARGGSGVLYIVMPLSQQTQSGSVKWVIGAVKDEDENKIDEIFSAQSPGELIQGALGQEMKRAGYTITSVTSPPADVTKMLVITTPELVLDQISSTGKLTASCRLRMPLEIWKNGHLVKKMEYNATYSNTTVTDRDLLARAVLGETLHSTMNKAIPELVSLLESEK